ncbi:MAG: methyl-accepting chemotaxis protein [Spirochaetaceae bacterium]|jgi:methyl-accepting chemotaxis protein|nr:methyl-accepting chemotaxis protein [Spirochaetaceae bacterium]
MTIAKRIVILNSLVVLSVSLSIGLLAVATATRVLEHTVESSIEDQAKIASKLMSQTIHTQLDILQELANRARTQTMNFEVQKESLLPDIARVKADDFAIVYPDGSAPHLKGGESPNLASREYVRKALLGRQSVSDLIVGGAVSTPYPLINYVVPITLEGKVLGALLARNDATVFSDIVKSVNPQQGGYVYLVNAAGTVIAHPDKDIVMQRFSAIESAKTDTAYKTSADAMRIILAGKQGAFRHDIAGKRMFISYAPVPDFDMTLIITIEEGVVLRELVHLRNRIFMFIAVFMALGILSAPLVAQSIAKPVSDMARRFRNIAQGEGDLTQIIQVASKDEIGDLAHYFNLTVYSLKGMIITVKRQSALLMDIGNELSIAMAETAGSIKQITSHIQRVKERVICQSASVEETHTTMEQITGNIGKLSGHVEAQTKSVEQSSSSIEEMLENIHSVTQTLVKNAKNMVELTDASEIGKKSLQEVTEDIREIRSESEGLLEINKVMENIAAQTNLLSMNAAIQAAHAGESGKGFAVVAGEIRKLAVSSGEQSKTISLILQKIKVSIENITASASAVLDRFEVIDKGVRTVSDQETLIRNAMEEQGEGSKQILEAVEKLNDLTRHVQSGSVEMLNGSREVIAESHTVETITEEITGGMTEMADGADQINVAVNQVNALSVKNRDNIDLLVREVSRFKVD